MTRRNPCCWTLMMLALLAVPASRALHAQTVPPAQTTRSVADERMRAGDALRIEIWREKELSGDFAVDESGSVTLPMLGQQNVAGRTFAEVRDQLRKLYAVQLENPSITITFLKRVYILGEVRKPDLYGVDPTLTLAGAIALAGGAQEWGDLNRVRVIDAAGNVRVVQSVLSLASADVRSGDQIFVDRRSWLARNSGVLAGSVFSSLITGLVTLLVIRNQ